MKNIEIRLKRIEDECEEKSIATDYAARLTAALERAGRNPNRPTMTDEEIRKRSREMWDRIYIYRR